MIKHSVTETHVVSVHEVLPKKASEGFHYGISEGTIKYLEALGKHSQVRDHLVTWIQVQMEKNIIRNIFFFSSFHKSNHFLGLKRNIS